MGTNSYALMGPPVYLQDNVKTDYVAISRHNSKKKDQLSFPMGITADPFFYFMIINYSFSVFLALKPESKILSHKGELTP